MVACAPADPDADAARTLIAELDAALAAICGASPLQASSGNCRHHRLNRGGNRQANATGSACDQRRFIL
jgi:hypothetical protein